MDTIESLSEEIVDCRLCPRLVKWREDVARTKRKSFSADEYWGRPVPYFGDPGATRLIFGLAPAAHGANRTGRMFTGDRSGDFLFAALHRMGVANQPTSVARGDGLELTGVLIAASVHCAPPANKPTPEELATCGRYLSRLLAIRQWESVLVLGGIAWTQLHRHLGVAAPPFGHSQIHRLPSNTRLVGCYHPSQQNTFTGRLTPEMLDQAIAEWLR